MRIGSSITLITIGAIFAFAVRFDLAGLDLQTVGYILIIMGILTMVLTFELRRRRTARAIRTDVPPSGDATQLPPPGEAVRQEPEF